MSEITGNTDKLAETAWEEVIALLEGEVPGLDIHRYEDLLKLNFANAFIIDFKNRDKPKGS